MRNSIRKTLLETDKSLFMRRICGFILQTCEKCRYYRVIGKTYKVDFEA